MRIKWYYSVKMSFPPYLWGFFDKKNQKIFKVGKVIKYDEESVFSRKKRFHLLKSLLYKNGKAQNIPVVAGCLVQINISNLLWQNSGPECKTTISFVKQFSPLSSHPRRAVSYVRMKSFNLTNQITKTWTIARLTTALLFFIEFFGFYKNATKIICFNLAAIRIHLRV